MYKRQVPKIRTYAILSDLRYAVRGGRLPRWVKSIADFLRLNPIICTTREGKVSLCGFMLGSYNRIERFARTVARRAPKGPVEIGIGQAICKDDALELEDHLRKLVPDIRKLVVTGLGTGIGVHGGPRTLLVSIQPYFSAQDVARGAD